MLIRKRASAFGFRLGGMLLAYAANAWWSTLEYRVVYDEVNDPGIEELTCNPIYLFWHEYIPVLWHLRPHCRIAVLLSQHKDAELLTHMSQFNGFGIVRGSTNRGGVAALKRILNKMDGWGLGITPDGPRGPRRSVAPGCVFLSSRLNRPIIPVGLAYKNPWRIKRAWDQFAIPRPGSQARVVFGKSIQVPNDADRLGLESFRQIVETEMHSVSKRAEDWAENSSVPSNSQIMYRVARYRK